jgi:hypothetical protein
MGEADRAGGIGGKLRKIWPWHQRFLTFAGLYFMKTKPNTIPATSRLQPTW